MARRLLVGIITASVILCRIGAAQSLPPLDEYQIRVFGPADGLLAADVTGLAQTPDGFIYLASGRGLLRFDGYAFRHVETPGAPSSFIDRMWMDRKGRLILFSHTGVLGYLEEQRFHTLPALPVPVRGVWDTADGRIWLGGSEGLVRLTLDPAPTLTLFTTDSGLPSNQVLAVVDVAGGRRLIVASHGVARLADGSEMAPLRFDRATPVLPQINNINIDSAGIWVSSADSANRSWAAYVDAEHLEKPRSGSPSVPIEVLERTAPRGVLTSWTSGLPIVFPHGAGDGVTVGSVVWARAMRARDGTLWIVVEREPDGPVELVRWRGRKASVVALRSSLDFRVIETLIEDHEGSVWIGTDRGLIQVIPRRLFALGRRHGLAESFVAPVLETRDGAVWIGTWGGGLHRYVDGALEQRYTSADGLPGDYVRALHESADGTLWVGCVRGYAAIRNDRVVVREQLNEQVRAFAEPTDGALWIGTQSRLLRRTADGVQVDRPERWVGREIWALHAARDGALWIGSEHGLFRLSRDSLREFGHRDGLRSPFVASIYEEADGTLWFGTYESGLHRYRAGRLIAVTTDDGLPHNGIWQIVPDSRNGLWMSSDRGLFRVDRAALNAAADSIERGDGPVPPLHALAFNETDGLPSREFNRASPGGWALSDGRILFNGLDGAVVFDPTRAAEPRPSPPMTIHEVVADGETVIPGADGRRHIPAGARQVAFHFAALSYVAPGQNRYRYRLEGYDSDWIDGGTQTRASYTNLPPGRYTFRVEGSSGGSAWSPRAASVALILPPLVSQAWWARTLLAAALAALLLLAYRLRVRRLLELERLRLRIASDLHDDVGSNLSSIALLSEMLQKSDARVDRRHLERIRRAAVETIDALRDIIWVVDPEHDRSADLLRRMRGVAADMLNGTAYTFADADVEAQALDMAFMRDVLLIYKEALHNAVRHGRPSHVTIDVSTARGAFVLRVQDDGTGFDEHLVERGNGLASMRRRAHQAGGSFVIASTPNEGTVVTFTAPLA